jgi:hypothetical protein
MIFNYLNGFKSITPAQQSHLLRPTILAPLAVRVELTLSRRCLELE